MGKDELKSIKEELSNCGPMHPGKISKQYVCCNKKNCHCKSKTAQKKHGPYYQLSYSVKGKSSTRFVKIDDVDKVEKYINEYNRTKMLLQDLAQFYVKEFKKNGW